MQTNTLPNKSGREKNAFNDLPGTIYERHHHHGVDQPLWRAGVLQQTCQYGQQQTQAIAQIRHKMAKPVNTPMGKPRSKPAKLSARP